MRFRGDGALYCCDKIFNAVVELKNTQYQRAAINRARFLLSGDEDVRGQLKEILLGINEVMNEQEMNLGGIYRMEFLDDLVRIYSSSVMDGNNINYKVKSLEEVHIWWQKYFYFFNCLLDGKQFKVSGFFCVYIVE